MIRRLFPALLTALVLLSLGLNLYLLVTILQIRSQLLALGAVAGPVIETVALDLENAAEQNINISVPINEIVPISTTIRIDTTFEVPLKMDVPVNTTINVPMDLGVFGRQDLAVPINTTIPIDMQVPIPINHSVPIRTNVPLDMAVPINIEIGETPFANHLQRWATALREFQKNLSPP